jgi:hypothetical protein
MIGKFREAYRSIFRVHHIAQEVQTLLAAQQIELLKSRITDPKRLETHGFKVYSQYDEDGIIAEIFRRIGTSTKRFVEFGCGDGRENCTAFLILQGWSGLWMDGSEDNIRRAHRLWGEYGEHLTIREAFVTPDNINALVVDAGLSGEIDLLVIDVDGNDYHIMEAIDVVSPRVVCAEYNAKFPPPFAWILPRNDAHVWDGSDRFSASLSAYAKLMDRKGYELVGCTLAGVNAFFVRRELVADRFVQPATPELLYQPARHYLLAGYASGHRPRE